MRFNKSKCKVLHLGHSSPFKLGGGCAQQGLERSGEFPVGTARCRSPSLPLLLLLFLLSASPPPSLPPSPPPFPSSPLTTSSLSLRLFSLHLPSPLLTFFLLICIFLIPPLLLSLQLLYRSISLLKRESQITYYITEFNVSLFLSLPSLF